MIVLRAWIWVLLLNCISFCKLGINGQRGDRQVSPSDAPWKILVARIQRLDHLLELILFERVLWISVSQSGDVNPTQNFSTKHG